MENKFMQGGNEMKVQSGCFWIQIMDHDDGGGMIRVFQFRANQHSNPIKYYIQDFKSMFHLFLISEIYHKFLDSEIV